MSRTFKRRLCEEDECTTWPNFNFEGETRPRFCVLHKLPGMSNVRSKRCEGDGCASQPIFNFEGEGTGRFCSVHKLPGMSNVRTKRCEGDGCASQPTFNVEGMTTPRFCKVHKLPGMVNVIMKPCQEKGCPSQPTFNVEGMTTPRFCKVHKLPGMVDVRSKRCEGDGCASRPSFNVEGMTRPRFCKVHKLPGMVNVIAKPCEGDGCTTRPSFNIEGMTTPRFCSVHKLPGMVNVIMKPCQEKGCASVNPVFNFEGERTGRFCGVHKKNGMINVVTRRCEETGCTTQSSYGLPGHPASFCARHHRVGTMRNPNRKCHCRETATHGITQPERCEQHALAGDNNMVERECSSCMLPCILNSQGVCADCFAFQSGRTPRLAKQREVVQFLDNEFAEFPYDSVDRTTQDLKDCGRYERPDVLWDRVDRLVILEVDEEQHRDRPCECEQARMMNISQAYGCERTVWIRYNPDSFKSPEAHKWSRRKRHEVLKQWLGWALTEELPYTISVVYLFFDGFREGHARVEKFL